MITRIKQLVSGRTGRLIIASVLSQGAFLLASPILTRLYPVEALGVLGVYIAVLGILVPIAGGRYEQAIPVATSDEDSAQLVALAMTLTVTTAVVVGGVFAFAAGLPWFDKMLSYSSWDIKAFHYATALIPIGVIPTSAYQIGTMWALRRNNINLVARTRITQGLVGPVFQLAAGVLGLGSIGLALGHALGQSSGIVTVLVKEGRQFRASLGRLRIAKLRAAAREWHRYPKYSLASTMLNGFGANLPMLFLAATFGSATTGLYALAQTIVYAPLDIIGRSVAQVYMTDISAACRSRDKRARAVFLRNLRNLIIVALGIAVPAVLLAPLVVPFAFGAKWEGATIFVQILAVVASVRLVTNPLACSLDVFGRQDLNLVQETVRIGGVLLVLLLASTLNWEARLTVGLLGIAQISAYLTSLAMSWRVVVLGDSNWTCDEDVDELKEWESNKL